MLFGYCNLSKAIKEINKNKNKSSGEMIRLTKAALCKFLLLLDTNLYKTTAKYFEMNRFKMSAKKIANNTSRYNVILLPKILVCKK